MNLPSWLKITIPTGIDKTEKILKKNNLNTVCSEAKCPNRADCFSKKTATFLALGKKCTRNCAFCNVDFDKNPSFINSDEPKKIAKCIQELKLSHAVITMVTRDDLTDGGASHIANIIKEIRDKTPKVTIEVLVSDFLKNFNSIDIVLNEKPDIFNHNIETVKRLTPKIRHIANYKNSLEILKYAKNSKKSKFVKSGIMVGLGEEKKEVFETIKDLHKVHCDILTIGQYLQPNKKKYPVKKFIHPSVFKEYEAFAKKIGVKNILSSSFVRSSYNASKLLNKANY